MTIPASVSEISYQGNGVSKTFAVPFAFDVAGDLRVILRDSDGNESSVSYTTTGGNGSTGTVVLPTAPAVGTTLVIYDDPEVSQQVDYLSNDGFPAETHEHALDKLTRIAKRTRKMIGRSLRVPDGENDPGTIPPLEQRIGMYLAFGPDGNPVPASGTGADAGLRADLASSLSGNGIDLVAGGVRRLSSDLIFTIPTDFETLQDAIDFLSERYYPRNGKQIILILESGYTPSAGLIARYRDCSNFLIQSADPIITVANDFSGSFIDLENARGPILDCLVDANGKGSSGIHIKQGSMLTVRGGCGVVNAGTNGCEVSASIIYAIGAVWDGATEQGIRLEQAATGTAQGASADGCGLSGVFISRGSTLNFIDGSAQNCGQHGAQVQRGRLACGNANFSGAAEIGINAREASNVMAGTATANGCGTGIYVTSSAVVDFRGGECKNSAEYGVECVENGSINLLGAEVSGSGIKDLRVRWGGKIAADGTITTHGSPSIEDVEGVPQFNVQTGNGLITCEGADTFPLLGFEAAIADDDVASFMLLLPGNTSGQALMSIQTNVVANGCPNGIIRVRTGSSPGIDNIVLERTTDITLTTGALTGTTGSDGDFTISTHTDGRVYFENRTGSTRSIVVTFLGR